MPGKPEGEPRVERAGALVVGTYLRSLRRERGLLLRHAAEALKCSTSVVARIEAGRLLPTGRDVARLLRRYGAPADGEQADLLADLARGNTASASLAFDEECGWVGRLKACESMATGIVTYSAWGFPALVHSAEYAAHWWRNSALPNTRGSAGIADRSLPVDHGKDLIVLLEESVLMRACDAGEVMAGQLAHLVRMIERSGTSLRIVPMAKSVPPPRGTLIELCLGSRVLHVEESIGAMYATGRESHKLHGVIEDALRNALSEADSLTLLREARNSCPGS
ncbi:Scr1 family TA system antitoxin-like transcriptional regulator [Streptomyces sp. NPDC014894]|uniref:helix-turn-helix domain-containing protein n=1 Tax=Streptomyces sp. NPDC014894 TaxID=3364931 RepID=UPI0037017B78